MFNRYFCGGPRWRAAYACTTPSCATPAYPTAEACRPNPRARYTRRDRAEQGLMSRYSMTRSTGSMGGLGGGPMFGIRRPLRKLSWRLDLREEQAQRMADVLNRLKHAYAQANLDRERSNADVASLFDRDAYSADQSIEALKLRTHASQELAEHLEQALEALFGMLDADQRREFARMIRAGEITL